MFQTKFVEKIKKHIFWFRIFYSENRAVCEIMWKNVVRIIQATDGNMAHALCVLDN
jgi:hypothetical protein